MFSRATTSQCPTRHSTLPESCLWAIMPPESKDLSSSKDRSSSFHRLHTAKLKRPKGMYLTPEELRGFDKYKVWKITCMHVYLESNDHLAWLMY